MYIYCITHNFLIPNFLRWGCLEGKGRDLVCLVLSRFDKGLDSVVKFRFIWVSDMTLFALSYFPLFKIHILHLYCNKKLFHFWHTSNTYYRIYRIGKTSQNRTHRIPIMFNSITIFWLKLYKDRRHLNSKERAFC